MILEQRPVDYGIDKYIWTGAIVCEVIKQRWDVELKDSRMYDILHELGLSYQKAHRDYANADTEVQLAFGKQVKKNWSNGSLTKK